MVAVAPCECWRPWNARYDIVYKYQRFGLPIAIRARQLHPSPTMNAPVIMDNEKTHKVEEGSERQSDDGLHYGSYEEAPTLMDRLGVTPRSFKKRTLADKHNQLNQSMKGRHLHMIAIGGSIGAGLFVGSGRALSRGGPAALLIGFGIIGIVSCRIRLDHSRKHANESPDDFQRRLRSW